MTVHRSTKQPGGSLPSVDRSLGSPRRCLWSIYLLARPDHDGLGPTDHLELFFALTGSTCLQHKNSSMCNIIIGGTSYIDTLCR